MSLLSANSTRGDEDRTCHNTLAISLHPTCRSADVHPIADVCYPLKIPPAGIERFLPIVERFVTLLLNKLLQLNFRTKMLTLRMLLAFASIWSLALSCGCRSTRVESSLLPDQKVLEREQLVIHSDFHVPVRHRLIDELVARQSDIADKLSLPSSDEPINIYLFEDSERFQAFMQKLYPSFSDRRAFFVKNDTQLRVFAHWGARVGEDLRHEVTHGYLHSVVPNVALWMDEGFAEFFEVPRGSGGVNSQHVYLLSNRYRHSEWLPNLQRLEAIHSPADLTQADYAESWLWAHYLLEKDEATRKTGAGPSSPAAAKWIR